MVAARKADLRLDNDAFWLAMERRDASYDGEFVIASLNAGYYCRPSCNWTLPIERENYVFYPLPEAAEADGFRPCPDCFPRTAKARNAQIELIRKACQFIQADLDDSPTLDAIGAHVGLSPYHLQRVFKRIMGITPRQYADACRLQRLKRHLRDGESVTGALYDAGYSSSSRLYETSSARLGMTPATYRRGGEGMDIGYTLCDSPLGRMLVAMTERGVCAVHLGGEDDDLRAVLYSEYPAATIHHDPDGICDWVMAILEQMGGWEPHLDLPLDVRATAFQWRVWEALRDIPVGETRTYQQIAEAIGQPGAASAVAKAVADNPVAVVIPCHRAERADGETSSFYSKRGMTARRKLRAMETQEQISTEYRVPSTEQ
jgi:AraC family transcriptional regulator of adaptative response/methylated-DNA-[protein]-cysteine methyltransferase